MVGLKLLRDRKLGWKWERYESLFVFSLLFHLSFYLHYPDSVFMHKHAATLLKKVTKKKKKEKEKEKKKKK